MHRYLSIFWEQKLLPYSAGFLFFANLFAFLYLINYIWMFGLFMGIIIFFLTYLQIIYSSYLWPFLIPSLIRINKKITIPTMPTVSLFIYGSWSFIILGIIALTILNFLISDYSVLSSIVLKSLDYKLVMLIFIGSIIIGNVFRISIMNKFLKPIEDDNPYSS